MSSITKIVSSSMDEHSPDEDSESPGKKLMKAADALIELEKSESMGLGAIGVSKGSLNDLALSKSQALTGRLKILCSSSADEKIATVRALKIRPPSSTGSDLKKG